MSTEQTIIRITFDSGKRTFLVYWENFVEDMPVIANPDLLVALSNLRELASDLHNWPEAPYFFENRTAANRLPPPTEDEPF